MRLIINNNIGYLFLKFVAFLKCSPVFKQYILKFIFRFT